VSGRAPDGEGGAGEVGSCANGVEDPDEADVDCGGTGRCEPCSNNSRCAKDGDCESQFCRSGICTGATCKDQIQNQDETGVDCGGSCLPCDIGADCARNADCTGEYCAGNVCADHCLSKVQESDETDVDCGGVTCDPCTDLHKCKKASDCESSVCSKGKCAPATCSDQVKNQDETDIDCGGVCSQTQGCATGKRCNTSADCDSFICSAGKCSADIMISPADVLDDFEDGDLHLPANPARGDRVGSWYVFSDGSGVETLGVSAIERGTSSKSGLHVVGTSFQNWGSGLGVDLNTPASGQATKAAYDASAYSAVTFWARAENSTTVTVALPDVDTDAAGSTCSACGHHYYQTVSLTTSWQRFTISFSDLALEPGGVPLPSAFKPTGVLSLQLRFPQGANYDVFVDDVAFIKP
jgi:hypothetical protein